MRSADPIADYECFERECEDDESLCPVCDVCGQRITDDYYYEVGGMIFHLDCAERHSVESYREEEKQNRWILGRR